MHISERLPWLHIASYASIALHSILLLDLDRLDSMIVVFAVLVD